MGKYYQMITENIELLLQWDENKWKGEMENYSHGWINPKQPLKQNVSGRVWMQLIDFNLVC